MTSKAWSCISQAATASAKTPMPWLELFSAKSIAGACWSAFQRTVGGLPTPDNRETAPHPTTKRSSTMQVKTNTSPVTA